VPVLAGDLRPVGYYEDGPYDEDYVPVRKKRFHKKVIVVEPVIIRKRVVIERPIIIEKRIIKKRYGKRFYGNHFDDDYYDEDSDYGGYERY
jgi:hypothetical protein